MTSDTPYMIYVDEAETFDIEEMIAISRLYTEKERKQEIMLIKDDINGCQ